MKNDTFSFSPDASAYDPKNAYWLGRAAELAYQEQEVIKATTGQWGFATYEFFSHDSTQAFVAANPAMILISFRGTEAGKVQDWVSDARVAKTDGLGGRVHKGFFNALHLVWQDLFATVQEFRNQEQTIWCTGHSLGAALAVLATAQAHEQGVTFDGLYNFGQPRVGNPDFASNFDSWFKAKTFRFVNNNDIVPRVPTINYKHQGSFLYFDTKKQVHLEPDFVFLEKDRIKGRIQDLGKPGTDGLKDHSMSRYLECLKANSGKDPFAA